MIKWRETGDRRMRIALWALIPVACWIASLIPSDSAAEPPPLTVRVGAYENPPKVYTNREGIVVGIFPDILDTIAHEQGWRIEYVFGTWEQCLERLENNEIDIMVDIAFSKARGEKFLFSDEAVFLNWAAVYTKSGTSAESLLDLKNKTVAVVKADIHTVGENGIRQLDKNFDLGLTYLYVDSYRNVFEALDNGTADAGIVNRLYGSLTEKNYDVTRSPVVFNPVQLKFAFSRDNPQAADLCRRIDDTLDALKRDPGSVFHEVVNAYLSGVEFDRRFSGAMRTVPLTAQERTWLRKHSTLRVGVDPAYPPYSFINQDGFHQGVALDFIDLIGSHLGVHIEVVEHLRWPQILDGARERAVDLVLTAVETPERKEYLKFSKIYLPTPLVIMARQDDDTVDGPEDLDGKTVALVNRYSSADQVMGEHPSVKPVMVPTPIEGLTAVSVGEADYYVGVLGINDYLMRKHGIANLKVAARYDMRFGGQRIGVRSDWPELVTILDKALDSIPEKKRISIFNTWIPLGSNLEGPAALQQQNALTAAETAWIKAHPVIRCGVDPEFTPFEFYNKNGMLDGISSEYIKILSSRLGLNLEVVPDLSWNEVMVRAKRHDIDVLPCVARTHEREAFQAFSISYAKFHRVIITRTDTPFLASLDDVRHLRVAVQSGSSHEGYLRENSDIQPMLFDTLQEAVRAVAEGTADAFVGNIASATYWIRMQNLTNLKVAAPVSYETQNLHFAVRKDWPTLVGIINKGLSSISLSKEDKIRKKWVDVEYKPGLNPGDIWKVMLKVIAGALFVLVAILAWNYRLKKEIVRRKTAEEALQQTHNELECRIAERTADLAEANRTLQQEINDRKQMEIEKENLVKQLIQSQKMEAIGTMAGGIAHDFNNILMPIMGYTELTLSNLPAGAKDRDYLQQVMRASHRAKDLVKQILTFSRQDENEKQPIEVNPLVKETVKLLRSSLPSTIEIRETIDSRDSCILGCPTQIHQVVMNLCTNAYHAMRMGGGVLGVTISNTPPDQIEPTVPLEPANGDFVHLSVSDTGHGIDASIKDRILEPYFTTKPTDEGTGLGLSVVHGIVKNHGGHLTFHSEPDKGTTFHIFFPRIDRPNDHAEADIVEGIRGGDETIWVVDDDLMIAHMEKSMLKHFGYRVRVFTDSRDLWEAFADSTDPVDLVVTDMTMPKMTGAELAQKIIAIKPDLPIVLCSGFSETIDDQKAKALGIREFIMKPVVMNDLAETVRRLLDEKAQPAN